MKNMMKASLTDRLSADIFCRFMNRLRNQKASPISREALRDMKLSFSQFGEDVAVSSYFTEDGRLPEQGFYVDAGAFHPFRLSTTLLFHTAGWGGVNIDINEEKIARFQQMRPHDVNVCAALAGESDRKMKMMKYPMSATNRLRSSTDDSRSICGEEPLTEDDVETRTLSEILDASRYRDIPIDYLNIDCEGMDLDVAKGLDFARYSPRVITIEAFGAGEIALCEEFFNSVNYHIDGKLRHTLIVVPN